MDDRYSAPTRHEKAPYKTIVRVHNDSEQWNYYIQISRNEEIPNWLPLGKFFEKAFDSYTTNTKFIEECIRLFDYSNNKPLSNISRIIKE